MGCLVVILSLITPRFVVLILWFTGYLADAYGSWFWPTLGFFVAPTTTIAYAVARNLSTATGAITAAGTLVIVVGVLIDIGLIGGNARRRRNWE